MAARCRGGSISTSSRSTPFARDNYDRYVTNYLFTPLIYLDRNLQPIPGLADSWDISEDGLTYRFELNEKATFSDGTPVLASDVLFTLREIIDPASESVQTAGSFDTLDMTRTKVSTSTPSTSSSRSRSPRS